MRVEHTDEPSGRTAFALTAAAVWLLLVSPFAVFLGRHEYSLLNPEIALCLLAAAALALAVAAMTRRRAILRVLALSLMAALAADAQFDQLGVPAIGAVALVVGVIGWVLREHVTRIVVVSGLAFLASTILLETTTPPSTAALASGNETRPFVLHVVLDEHVGVAALPKGARYDGSVNRLRAFFERHQFRLFTNAFSEYFLTRYSLSQMLNLSSGRFTPGLLRIGTDTRYGLTDNKYFSRLAAQQYAVSVFQTTYLDVCADPRTVVHCESYDFAGIRELQSARLGWPDRLYAVSAAYLPRFTFYNKLRRAGRFVRNSSRRPGMPEWAARSIGTLPSFLSAAPSEHYGPLPTRAATERLISAVSNARRGQYVFAHLMLPHYPYVFRADCSFRPPSEWNARTDSDAPSGASNTPEGREVRYVQYLDQLECLYKDLSRLVDAIPTELQRDAIVILHGDHGSRINIVDPDGRETRRLAPTDVRDGYSTLLAIRGPAARPGDDEQPVAVSCALAALVQSEFTSVSVDPSCNADRTVFKVSRRPQVIATTATAVAYRP